MRIQAKKLLFDVTHDDDVSTEIESSCHKWSNGDRKMYSQKIRSIIHNLKNNSKFYDDVCQRKYTSDELMELKPMDINAGLWKPVYDSIENKRRKLKKSTDMIDDILSIKHSS